MYYFFGAGANCCGAIEFWGKEKIIAIVDNSEAKQGTCIEGISVISFEHFIKQYRGENIIITAYIASDAIIKQLEENGLYNYFVCPYMSSGFWSSSQIIRNGNLLDSSSIVFYDNNPIAERIAFELLKHDKNKKITYITEIESVNDEELLVIVKEEHEVDMYLHTNVLDIFQMMENEKTKNYSYLRNFKDLHKDEICFLVGNGPSLRASDLDRIVQAGFCSMGCNSIHKIFGMTSWRPTYYVMGDPFVYKRINHEIKAQNLFCFMRDFGEIDHVEEDIILYTSMGEKYYPGYPSFSSDLVKGVYGGRTVMYDMLQIAVYMGFKEIYLIGVDFSWGEDGRDTHFSKEYIEKKVIKDALKYKDEVMHAYIAARKYAEANGVKIYNATRGGKLEVFDRMDFDKLFSNEE